MNDGEFLYEDKIPTGEINDISYPQLLALASEFNRNQIQGFIYQDKEERIIKNARDFLMRILRNEVILVFNPEKGFVEGTCYEKGMPEVLFVVID